MHATCAKMHANTDPEAGGHAALKKTTHEDFHFHLGLDDLPNASSVHPHQTVTHQNREQKSEDSKNR